MRQELVRVLPPSPHRSSLLQPGPRPHLPGIPISLSHCPLMGGFVFSVGEETAGLGLDIEQDDRVGAELVARIAGKRECEESPRPSLLWVAKEAALKGLPAPLTLSRISIFDWCPLPSAAGYSFSFRQRERPSVGQGIAFQLGNLAVGCTKMEKRTLFS